MTVVTNPRDIDPKLARLILTEIGLTPVKFVRRMKKSDRTAWRWFRDGGHIPGPARAVLSAWQQLHRHGLPRPDEPPLEGDNL